MTTTQPTMLIEFATTAVTEFANWPQDGSVSAGFPYQWTVVATITPQPTSSSTTPTPYFYTGMDVAVGDWMSNAVGGFAWIIRTIVSADQADLTCIVEDVKLYNTFADSSGNSDGAPSNETSGFIFITDECGQPILSPLVDQVITEEWQTDLMGRFALTTPPVTTALKNYPTVTTTANAFILTSQTGVLEWVSSTLLESPPIPPYTLLGNATATRSSPAGISVTGPLLLTGTTLSLGDQIIDNGSF